MNEIDKTAQIITLKDGRKLGYGEFGDSKGKPIFHFHGYVGSRLEGKMFEEKVLLQHGVRIISVDRPGIGLSDFKPKRTLLEFPDDIVELADALGFDGFVVEGISGGGPYALACAYKIPDRLITCGVIAGMGPIELGTKGMMRSNRILFFLAKRFSWLFKILIKSQGKAFANTEKVKKAFQKSANKLPKPDKKLILDPEFQNIMIEEAAEAFHQSPKGPVYEGKIYVRPWGFNLEDISRDLRVYLWHGELDVNVPITMGHTMCNAIPNCEGKFYPNEAHLSVAINNIDEILTTLVK